MTEKQIRFCTASDGVRIAYATYGSGYPLILVPGWVSHLDIDDFLWDMVVDGLLEATGRSLMVARYDKRGTGLSQRGGLDLSVESRLQDIDAVADALKLRGFALDGISEGGPIALAYAARHPRRVSHLIIYGGFAYRGSLEAEKEAGEAMLRLIQSEWGLASSVFTSRLLAGASAEDFQKFARLQREGASADDAVTLLRMNLNIDVRGLLPSIKAPTLVIHGRNDQAIPFERGRELAQAIPNARFFAHDAGHYVGGEAAISVFRAVGEFLSDVTAPASARTEPATPEQSGLRTVLFTDITGSTALTQRIGDAQAHEIRRAHNAIVREALTAHGGTEIKHTGDGIMASFSSARGALECAVAIQRAVVARGDTDLQVHIGLNAGEPIAEERDLFGTSVDLARRVCDQAAGGEILVSDVVRQLAAGKGFLFADRGQVALRGFEDPLRLYDVRWRDSDA